MRLNKAERSLLLQLLDEDHDRRGGTLLGAALYTKIKSAIPVKEPVKEPVNAGAKGLPPSLSIKMMKQMTTEEIFDWLKDREKEGKRYRTAVVTAKDEE